MNSLRKWWLGQKLAEFDAAFAAGALPASDAPVAAKPGHRRS
jgi:hypothetical protein